MISVIQLQDGIRAISAEAMTKTPELHSIGNDIQKSMDNVYALFSDQAAGQSLVMELAGGLRHTNGAAVEIGMFDIQAQQVINQLAK